MGKHDSAELILKLYDLRREKVMREARNWIFGFNPTSAEDYWKTMMDPEVGPLSENGHLILGDGRVAGRSRGNRH